MSQRIYSPFFFVDAGNNTDGLTASEAVSYGIHTATGCSQSMESPSPAVVCWAMPGR